MALLTQVSEEQAAALFREWDLELAEWKPLQAGSVNSNFFARDQSGTKWFARLYEEQDVQGAEREVRLCFELAREGVPVARPRSCRNGKMLGELEGRPFALFEWVEGEWLCQGRVTQAHCRNVGRELARVHLAAKRLSPLGEGRFRTADMLVRLETAERQAPELCTWTKEIRKAIVSVESQRNARLPAGVIHGDLFRDNVLWQGDTVAALLDFESACHGPFAYDLMVLVLSWCYSDRFEVELAQAVFDGYGSLRPLSSAERDALEIEGSMGCLRFASTRLTDFELRAPAGGPPIRDFRRMLSRMASLQQGALSQVIAGQGGR